MRIAILLLLLIPMQLIAQCEYSRVNDVGEQIEFQEMRNDTLVVKGGVTGVIDGKQILYRWILFDDQGTIVGVYSAKGDRNNLSAVIQPGSYSLVRMTDHYENGRQLAVTASNTIFFDYRLPFRQSAE